jgi:single-stranded DNA-binding protein
LSLNKDTFEVKIVGNLITDPKIAQDEEGNKVCYCRIATNPRARKVDIRTGKVLTDTERHRLRTFADIKIPKTSAAEKFFDNMRAGDRVWIEGEGGTKKVPRKIWSEEDQAYVNFEVDVDGRNEHFEVITDDQLVIRVYKFGKIINDRGVPAVAYV